MLTETIIHVQHRWQIKTTWKYNLQNKKFAKVLRDKKLDGCIFFSWMHTTVSGVSVLFGYEKAGQRRGHGVEDEEECQQHDLKGFLTWHFLQSCILNQFNPYVQNIMMTKKRLSKTKTRLK